MAKKAPGVAPTEAPPTAQIPADAAAALYKDPAGPQRGVGQSEGAVNFAAITDAARAILTEPREPDHG